MPSINTIGGFINHGVTLTAWCEACQHTVELDLDALGQRLGFDHSVLHDALAPKLK
jgi:hypothetical protein